MPGRAAGFWAAHLQSARVQGEFSPAGDGTVLLRAERSGKGDGRVYCIHFTASDLEGSTSGVVVVAVPHSNNKPAVDSGGSIDSTR